MKLKALFDIVIMIQFKHFLDFQSSAFMHVQENTQVALRRGYACELKKKIKSF